MQKSKNSPLCLKKRLRKTMVQRVEWSLLHCIFWLMVRTVLEFICRINNCAFCANPWWIYWFIRCDCQDWWWGVGRAEDEIPSMDMGKFWFQALKNKLTRLALPERIATLWAFKQCILLLSTLYLSMADEWSEKIQAGFGSEIWFHPLLGGGGQK